MPPPPGKKARTKKTRAKSAKNPEPADSYASGQLHAKFEPLPPEQHVPEPAEVGEDLFAPFEAGEGAADDVAVWMDDGDDDDGAEDIADAETETETDAGSWVESYADDAEDDGEDGGSLSSTPRSSSLTDSHNILHTWKSNKKHFELSEPRVMYSGPRLTFDSDSDGSP